MAKEKPQEKKEETSEGTANESGYDFSNETPESLMLTLRVLMRKYPHQTTPYMKAVYDEIQKRGGDAPKPEDDNSEKDAA